MHHESTTLKGEKVTLPESIKDSGNVTRGEESQDATMETRKTATVPANRQKRGLSAEIKQMREVMIRHFEIQSVHQKTCWQRIYELVTSKGTTTSGMFAQKTNLIPKIYDRAKNNAPSTPKLKTIVTIAAAYDLDLSTTEELLRLAGHTFIPTSQEHDCYRFILTAMYGHTMRDKNELLASEGFAPLGSMPQGDTEEDMQLLL